jgi:hypothetical protein
VLQRPQSVASTDPGRGQPHRSQTTPSIDSKLSRHSLHRGLKSGLHTQRSQMTQLCGKKRAWQACRATRSRSTLTITLQLRF